MQVFDACFFAICHKAPTLSSEKNPLKFMLKIMLFIIISGEVNEYTSLNRFIFNLSLQQAVIY